MSRRKRMLEELNQDIRDHIERETQDNIERGMSPEEARYAALRKFGNVTRVKEETREVWSFVWFENLAQDVRYGARMLRKSPGFTAVAILTLALGIGANTAIFSIVYGVILQPLPYAHPAQLVVVARTAPRFDHPVPVSGPNFLDWRARAGQFQSLAGFDGRGFTVMFGNDPENILGAAVSPDFLSVLQVAPILGRNFLELEEHTGNDHVALLTHSFWKERLGGDQRC